MQPFGEDNPNSPSFATFCHGKTGRGIESASGFSQARDEETVARAFPWPDVEIAGGGRSVEGVDDGIKGEVGMSFEEAEQRQGIFSPEEGTGGIDEPSAGAERAGGGVEECTLPFDEVCEVARRKAPSRVRLPTPEAAAGAGGIHEGAVEHFGKRGGMENVLVFELDGVTEWGACKAPFCFLKGACADVGGQKA